MSSDLNDTASVLQALLAETSSTKTGTHTSKRQNSNNRQYQSEQLLDDGEEEEIKMDSSRVMLNHALNVSFLLLVCLFVHLIKLMTGESVLSMFLAVMMMILMFFIKLFIYEVYGAETIEGKVTVRSILADKAREKEEHKAKLRKKGGRGPVHKSGPRSTPEFKKAMNWSRGLEDEEVKPKNGKKGRNKKY